MRIEAVQAAGVGTRDDFYWTLHAVFVKRHEHSLLFDQAFRMFLQPARLSRQAARRDAAAGAAAASQREAEARRRSASQEALFAGHRRDRAARSPRSRSTPASPSPTARCCRSKDFAQMSAAEIAAAKDAIKRLVLPLDEVKTRRLAPHPHGHRIDPAPHDAREPQGRRRADRAEISRSAQQGSRRSSRCSIFPAR